MSETRKYTSRLLEMMDEGTLTPGFVALMCLKWMSEEEVLQMMIANEIDLEDEKDEED